MYAGTQIGNKVTSETPDIFKTSEYSEELLELFYVAEESPKKYEELDFTDDFMFCKVLTHNLELCRELLEIILEQKICKVELADSQKSIEITYDGKGIRMDVYVEDEENTVYDIEMQATDTKNLPKRSRYYQGMIDLNLIGRGENYKKLKKSFVIFICKFDAFGKNLCKYTFKNLCVEQPDIELKDETTKIFLNPYGKREEMSDELREFLKYLCGEGSESKFIKKLDEEVYRAKIREEWKVEYMTQLMRDQENIEKGIKKERYVTIERMLKKGIRPEQIAEFCSYDLKEVETVQQALSVVDK